MRKFLLAVFASVFGLIALFPPMTVEARYLTEAESSLRFLPVWGPRSWQNGQVMYEAEVNVGLLVGIVTVLIWVGVMAWLYRRPTQGSRASSQSKLQHR